MDYQSTSRGRRTIRWWKPIWWCGIPWGPIMSSDQKTGRSCRWRRWGSVCNQQAFSTGTRPSTSRRQSTITDPDTDQCNRPCRMNRPKDWSRRGAGSLIRCGSLLLGRCDRNTRHFLKGFLPCRSLLSQSERAACSFGSFLDPYQPRRVGDDRNGGEFVQQRASHRQENAGNGKPHRNRQHTQREDQILLDRPHRLARETQQVRQLRQVIGQERDLRRLNSNVSATQAHRYTHVRGRECWPIVHAIAHKCDIHPLGLQLLDDLHLLRRQHLGVHFADAQLSRDPLSRYAVVAGH